MKGIELTMSNLLDITRKYLHKANKLPSLATMTAKEARRMRACPSPSAEKIAPLSAITNTQFSARDGAQMPLRIYTPFGDGPFPVIIYYHGGGWVLNDLNTCHESCALLANKTKSIVVSVEYRLAPEFKFPIPLHDAFDAFRWTKETIADYNGNPQIVSVAGDSAGGNLAIGVSLLAKNEPGAIASQLLLYPVTDLSYSSNSYKIFEYGYGLDKEVMEWFGNYYIRSEEDAKNPLVAPLHATELADLPPTFIVVAENDVLRDEGMQFGTKLLETGVDMELMIAEGLVHSYFTKNDSFDMQIGETINRITDFLRRKL